MVWEFQISGSCMSYYSLFRLLFVILIPLCEMLFFSSAVNVEIFHIAWLFFRNACRFAAALKDLKVWVMNVVPVDSRDTLPIIYERGLIGIYHDWCESFSTYPRSYDLLHADHLFSVLKKRYVIQHFVFVICKKDICCSFIRNKFLQHFLWFNVVIVFWLQMQLSGSDCRSW